MTIHRLLARQAELHPVAGALGAPGRRPYTAPRTPVEQLLAKCWAEVLRVEDVGADQDFFDLGGDSMLAALLTSRIRQELGLEAMEQSGELG